MTKLALPKQRKKKDSSANGGYLRDKQELHGGRHASIAARAFELFEQRGWKHGYDVQDWLEAEKELYGSTT
jgi:Protein of unknown function (DUF2934)